MRTCCSSFCNKLRRLLQLDVRRVPDIERSAGSCFTGWLYANVKSPTHLEDKSDSHHNTYNNATVQQMRSPAEGAK
eukprot:6196134-Pleurochrysis_carterae.AAC.1